MTTPKTIDLGSTHDNLRALRAIKRLTNTQIGEIIDLDHSSVSKFMNGGTGIPLRKIEALLKACGARLVIVLDETELEAK